MKDFTAIATAKPLQLHPPLMDAHRRNEVYKPATGLSEAMDVAMLLGVPLLLTGEPGTGKTRSAHWLAYKLGLKPLVFDVKSTTSGSDLLYSFDDVGRFRDASHGKELPLVRYLRFNALGLAFLRSAGSDAALQTAGRVPLKSGELQRHKDLLVKAFGAKALADRAAITAEMLHPDGSEAAWQAEHQVVLIDELDKAPRDTPNDLLAEVEEMAFTIPELGIRIVADPAKRPIIIITSNSEKSLPDPFLRRCAFFHIPFPEAPDLLKILEGSLGLGPDEDSDRKFPLLDDAIAAVLALRERKAVRRPPGTAELLAWLDILVTRERLQPDAPLKTQLKGRDDLLKRSVTVLLKSEEDQVGGVRFFKQWLGP